MTKAKMPVDIRQRFRAPGTGAAGTGTDRDQQTRMNLRARTARRMSAFALTLIASCTPIPENVQTTRAIAVQTALPPMQTFAETPAPAAGRGNAQMAEDFLDLSFRMESGKAIPAMTRFEGPISVRLAGPVPPSMSADLARLLGRLRREAGLDIALTDAPRANITIEAVPQAILQRAVPRAACFVVPRIASWSDFLVARNTPQTDWTTLTRRDRAVIFIPADAAPQEVRDCLHEELAQALGPLNDLYRLPDSVFNDDNIHTVLTGFDMLMLRTYYDPALANGMTRAQAAAVVPGVLARLNPRGDRRGASAGADTSREWIDSIETALTPNASPLQRRASAQQAVVLSQTYGWRGVREAFAWFALARLQVGHNQRAALDAFNAAEAVYLADPATHIHAAHISVQKAAFALSAGDAQATLALTEAAIPIARTHQNAALLATLMMFRAEALEMTGDSVEARAVRLDSLGWARYGFGSDSNVQARLKEVAALRPF